jgi:hypothetical protein
MALFNDITMLPIAYDSQQASAIPEVPVVWKMLTLSFGLGVAETVCSLIFAYGAKPSGIFMGDFPVANCPKESQAAIWVQMFIAAELLIFVTRAPKLIIFSIPPSIALLISVILGCIVVSLMAGCSKYFGNLEGVDIVIIWVYDLIVFVLMDFLKMGFLAYFNENSEVLPDTEETGSVSDKPHKHGHNDLEHGTEVDNLATSPAEDFTRQSVSISRLDAYAEKHGAPERFSTMERPSRVGRKSSVGVMRESLALSGRLSVAHSVDMASGAEVRPSFNLTSGSLRPANVPAARRKY